MKKIVFSLMLLCGSVTVLWSIPAFPGAEGFGAAATGGRGGSVIYVTNLAAAGTMTVPGSLQWAINQPGPKYIHFKVSGVVSPGRAIEVMEDNITIAGQTSPGGIKVQGMVIQSDQTCEQEGCTLPSKWPENIIIRN